MKKLALGAISALMLLALVTSLVAMADHASEGQREAEQSLQATTITPTVILPTLTPTVPVTRALQCDVSVEGFALRDGRAVLTLKNSGRRGVTLQAIEVAWPADRNGALREVRFNEMHLWAGEEATSPATIVPLMAVAVPGLAPGATAELEFTFARRAVESPYTITVFFFEGCSAFFSTEEKPELPRRIQFEGPIEALPDDPEFLGQWVIGGRMVRVNERTIIAPVNVRPQVGDWARVKAVVVQSTDVANAPLLATYIGIIKPVNHKGRPIEFAGTIEEKAEDNSYIVVRGITVTLDIDTVIACPLIADPLITCPLTVDSTVRVQGYQRADGTVLARKIVVEPQAVNIAYTEFEGPIEAFTHTVPADWIIGGRTVRVDPQTYIEGTPRQGAMAEVRALLQSSYVLLAKQIRIAEPTMALATRKIEGLIQLLPDDPQLLGQWVIVQDGGDREEPVTIIVDEKTFIDQSRARVQVGARVEADVQGPVEGPLLALRIEVKRGNL